jgi:hypothetical protein
MYMQTSADPFRYRHAGSPVAFLYLFVATTSLEYSGLKLRKIKALKDWPRDGHEYASSMWAPLETSAPLRGQRKSLQVQRITRERALLWSADHHHNGLWPRVISHGLWKRRIALS